MSNHCEQCETHHSLSEDVKNAIKIYFNIFGWGCDLMYKDLSEDEKRMVYIKRFEEEVIPYLVGGHTDDCLRRNLNMFVEHSTLLDVVLGTGFIDFSILLINLGADPFGNVNRRPISSAGIFFRRHLRKCEDLSNIPTSLMMYLLDGITERELASIFVFRKWDIQPLLRERFENIRFICEMLIRSGKSLDYVVDGAGVRQPFLVFIALEYYDHIRDNNLDEMNVLHDMIQFLLDNYCFDLTLEYMYYDELLNIPSIIASLFRNSIFDDHFAKRRLMQDEAVQFLTLHVPQPINEELHPHLKFKFTLLTIRALNYPVRPIIDVAVVNRDDRPD